MHFLFHCFLSLRKTLNIIKISMQQELFEMIKLFGGFIPLHFFSINIDGKNPILLKRPSIYCGRCHRWLFFGIIYHANGKTREIIMCLLLRKMFSDNRKDYAHITIM